MKKHHKNEDYTSIQTLLHHTTLLYTCKQGIGIKLPLVMPHWTIWWNNDAVDDNVRLFSESQLYAADRDKVCRRQMAEVAIRPAGWSPFFVNLGKAKNKKEHFVYNACVCVFE